MLEIEYFFSILPFLLDYYEAGGLPCPLCLICGWVKDIFSLLPSLVVRLPTQPYRLKKKAGANLVMYDVVPRRLFIPALQSETSGTDVY